MSEYIDKFVSDIGGPDAVGHLTLMDLQYPGRIEFVVKRPRRRDFLAVLFGLYHTNVAFSYEPAQPPN